jgi:hypothetical protein
MLRLPGPLLYNKGGPILFLVGHFRHATEPQTDASQYVS